jgi:arylsulfatase A
VSFTNYSTEQYGKLKNHMYSQKLFLIMTSILAILSIVITPTESQANPKLISPEKSSYQARSVDQPNIIVIFADDLGYGDIGTYGSQTIKTPNIDRMAAEGAKFDQFYSASPVCTPSRAALLTGRYPIRQGIHGVFYPESFQGMDPEEVTIAEMLKDVDYVTGLVGKWHLGHHDKFMPWNQGFDEFFGVPYSNDMGGLYYFRNKEAIFDEIDQRYMTKTYTEEALKFIDNHHQQPFFLYLAHNMPHVPIYASPEFKGKSAGGLYGDVVEELDWSVGQILQRLDELSLSENTLVIFTSDNGPWLLMGDHGGSAGQLRAGKQFTFEGGMRVPMVASWPGKIPAGIRPEGMATMMDWLPTFAALTGASLPDDRPIDGKDISGVLMGHSEREDQELFYYMSGQLRAYRSGDWKLKLPYKGKVPALSLIHSGFIPSHDMLLFNLKDDPQERSNLADQEVEIVTSMLEKMEIFKESLGELPAAKKTGKNMDFGPYIRLVTILLFKVFLVTVLTLTLVWLSIRYIRSRLKSKASEC